LQGKAKAKANANSKSNANDKEHTPRHKEHTPKKRCSRKTPDEHAPKQKDHTPEKQQQTKAKHKERAPKTSNMTPNPKHKDHTPEKQNKAIAVKRPFFSLEKSRGQFMCRTGDGGAGSTYQISFGACQKYTSESAARAAAERWVRGECARRGIERNSSSWLGCLQRLRIWGRHWSQLVKLAGVPAKTARRKRCVSCGPSLLTLYAGPAR